MKLAALVGPEITAPVPLPDVEIVGITSDSREVRPGMLFAALSGAKTDGRRFIAKSVASGASAVLVRGDTLPLDTGSAALLRADEPRRALALIAARFYQRQPGKIIAVTGTNGKTSVAEFARQILAALGVKAASLGTIGLVRPDGAVYGSLTTPDPVTLHKTLADLADEGVTHLVMEASSHGLDQFRLDGVRLTTAAFNNLGRDHLDYHPTVEAYLAAKLRLFRELMQPGQTVVINADGAASGDAMAAARERGLQVLTIGRSGANLRLERTERQGFEQVLSVSAEGQRHSIRLPLIGEYQASNALVAAALVAACGIPLERALGALSGLKGVSGRLEVAGRVRGGIAVVDYAHKPEALAAALEALRPFATGRLISLFGCGGDRDRGKRPIMGAISVEKADVTIVTDDNPRSEKPEAIRAEILAAAKGAYEIADRATAIRAGIAMLGGGDVLLVAGKGHETGQIVGDVTLPFSDQKEVAEAIAATPAVPLWGWDELVQAAGGIASAASPQRITGFSIDTRSLVPGDVFIALKDQRDGHDFVADAFRRGAAAALVRREFAFAGPGALICVDDPLKALGRIAAAARARARGVRVVAITGSAGKTGTTAMLRRCLISTGARVHAPEKSFNNHWGVPLTLARMPVDTDYALIEIGMNHAGEIAPLTRLARPDIAIVTNVLPVHVGNFADGEAGVARAKAEIFEGLAAGGIALIPVASPHAALLDHAAAQVGARRLAFGKGAGAFCELLRLESEATGTRVAAMIGEGQARREISWRLGAPGAHLAENSVAVAAACALLGVDVSRVLATLAGFRAATGRGERSLRAAGPGRLLLIDESYNANPASMAAALAALALVPRSQFKRRVAILGDMLELGGEAQALHLGLEGAVRTAEVDVLFACGPCMQSLHARVPAGAGGRWTKASLDLIDPVIESLGSGDCVMIKGSLGTRMAPIVEAIKKRFPAVREEDRTDGA